MLIEFGRKDTKKMPNNIILVEYFYLCDNSRRYSLGRRAALLCKPKGNGCKQHSSGKVNLPSSQPMLSHRRRKRRFFVVALKNIQASLIFLARF